MPAAAPKEYNVICQEWIESEAGWGQRPDGASLHLTSRDAEEYIKEYTRGRTGPTPHEYDRPDGRPLIIPVSLEWYRKIKKSKKGLRIWQDEYRAIKSRKPEPTKASKKAVTTCCMTCMKTFEDVPKGTRDTNECVFCSEKRALGEIQVLTSKLAKQKTLTKDVLTSLQDTLQSIQKRGNVDE